MIKKGDIAIIYAGDDHLYYLGILVSKIHETETTEKDDYQHKIPASQCVMKCNYLELFRESKDCDIYYIEEKKVALMSAYCIAGICPELKPCQEKHQGKWVDMFQVSHDMHQAILELLDSDRLF